MSNRSKSFLAVALAVGLGGCASGAPTRTVEEPEVAKANCVRDTGTRIKPADGKCVSGPGRVYTAEELQQSGAATTSEALRRIRR